MKFLNKSKFSHLIIKMDGSNFSVKDQHTLNKYGFKWRSGDKIIFIINAKFIFLNLNTLEMSYFRGYSIDYYVSIKNIIYYKLYNIFDIKKIENFLITNGLNTPNYKPRIIIK